MNAPPLRRADRLAPVPRFDPANPPHSPPLVEIRAPTPPGRPNYSIVLLGRRPGSWCEVYVTRSLAGALELAGCLLRGEAAPAWYVSGPEPCDPSGRA